MLTILVPVMLVSQIDLEIRTVDLNGDPVREGVRVFFPEFGVEQVTDQDGIARFKVELDGRDKSIASVDGTRRQRGFALGERERIWINLQNDPSRIAQSQWRDLLLYNEFVGRTKRMRWVNEEQLGNGFVVPVWTFTQIRDYADEVVVNPTHYAVALRRNQGGNPIVVAKAQGDSNTWIEQFAPQLPVVRMPDLAQSLYRNVEVGAVVPTTYDDQLAKLHAEVDRITEAARVCMRAPQNVPPHQPAPGPDSRPPPAGPQFPGQPLTPPRPPATSNPPITNPPIAWPPAVQMGSIRVTNPGRGCDFTVVINGRPFVVRRAQTAVIQSPVEPVVTQIVSQSDSPRQWTHWRVIDGAYVLQLHARSEMLRRSMYTTTWTNRYVNRGRYVDRGVAPSKVEYERFLQFSGDRSSIGRRETERVFVPNWVLERVPERKLVWVRECRVTLSAEPQSLLNELISGSAG